MKRDIYGAGSLRQAFLKFLKRYKLEKEIFCFVDKEYESVKEIDWGVKELDCVTLLEK